MTSNKATYVVLNDGTTFTPLRGCKLVTIDEDALGPEMTEALDNGDIGYVISDGSADAITVHDLFSIIERSPVHLT